MVRISAQMDRQVGVLINRRGHIYAIAVGNRQRVDLPPEVRMRGGISRLSGHRWIHTSFSEPQISPHDQNQLFRYQLDLLAQIQVDRSDLPGLIGWIHVDPSQSGFRKFKEAPWIPSSELDFCFDEFIENLESELRRKTSFSRKIKRENRAILCVVHQPGDFELESDLAETRELARTVGLEIVDVVIQYRDPPDPKTCLGKGKLEEVFLKAAELEVDLLLFQQDLTPNQARNLFDLTKLRIIDRTQLILDIFAQRAKSHDGKLQVELAQLRYTLPRLREKESQMSRLVGGIGGRGPGETKLEIHRRRARERIHRLEKEIEKIAKKRAAKRALRNRKGVPIVSIVGYTNAGKSTLLNTLTEATALSEDKLFATLDPFSKRLRFPKDRELILTDTVGFIQNLPPDLMKAFRATLEEMGEADLILHVADLSNPRYAHQIEIVNQILEELNFQHIPQILVLNKIDCVSQKLARRIANSLGAVTISALNAETCRPLLNQMEARLWQKRQSQADTPSAANLSPA